MNMACLTHFKDVHGIPKVWITLIQIYNILIGVLNIAGNAILIWTLRRTRQTKSLSFRLIAIMSVSDMIIGITGLVFLTMLLLELYENHCWLKLCTEFVLITCNYISLFMLFLIAYDRYFHMKYLERYSEKFTKRRGHLLVVVSIILALCAGAVFILQIPLQAHLILESAYTLLTSPIFVSIIILYKLAQRTLRRKAHQITRRIIHQNRALGKAAKRVSTCIIVLSSPIFILHILDRCHIYLKVFNEIALNTCGWFAHITFLGNAFSSSIIFISQNVPIQRFLKRTMLYHWNRFRPIVDTTETSTFKTV